MGLFKRSKKEIPAELPDLALDRPQEAPQNNVTVQNSMPSKPLVSKSAFEFPTQKSVEINKNILNDSSDENEDKGFFKDLIKNLVQEQKNVDKMESFYNNRFATEDLVHQMRSYWEEQKPELLLRNVGADLKEKMAEKTSKLHQLEKEWQDVYFALLSKEEEIRNEEKELKEVISEFIAVCKRSLGKKPKK